MPVTPVSPPPLSRARSHASLSPLSSAAACCRAPRSAPRLLHLSREAAEGEGSFGFSGVIRETRAAAFHK